MRDALTNFLDGYRRAWENRDPDAVAALFTTDGTYREKPFEPTFEGHDRIRDYWAEVTAAQSDITVRYGQPLVVGDRAAVEWWTTLTNEGSPATLAGAFLLRFAPDGRCAELVEYFMNAEDTVTPPSTWGG
ncbi:MAG: nuclear transport factor 2 family protein [Chloroflexota bacterium]|nr:nuclear transport factor 2 family protein [Chloroflexota bacterium]